MITPALVILLIVLGWGSAAFAMLWGMLRVTRHHQRPRREPQSPSPEAGQTVHSGRAIALSA
jgi:hypothetical protein